MYKQVDTFPSYFFWNNVRETKRTNGKYNQVQEISLFAQYIYKQLHFMRKQEPWNYQQ